MPGYVYYNPNPRHRFGVGDCTVRAISKALNLSWNAAYIDLAVQGYLMADMPSSNAVMDSYLRSQGFTKHLIDDGCPEDCYTVGDFAHSHPYGTYILGTGTHVICIQSGTIFDSWPSYDEIPQYFYKKENES